MLWVLIYLILLESAWLGVAFPVEYKGWINNCSFYFESELIGTSSAEGSFIQCHSQMCEEEYLLNCDKFKLVRNYTLSQCMPMCCSEASSFRGASSTLQFLTDCEFDYLQRKNKQQADLNRLPFIVLGYTFLGVSLLLLICFVVAYWQQISIWARQRLANRNRNDAGIQMRNLLN